MGQKPLHNLVMVMTSPAEGNPQTIASLTVPEPAAFHLTAAIAGVMHATTASEIKRMLASAFQQIDECTVNVPGPANKDAPDGVPLTQVYKDDLIAIAEGRKVVMLNDGEPFIMTVEEAEALDPLAGGSSGSSASGTRAAGSGSQASISSTEKIHSSDGSASGEKHRGKRKG